MDLELDLFLLCFELLDFEEELLLLDFEGLFFFLSADSPAWDPFFDSPEASFLDTDSFLDLDLELLLLAECLLLEDLFFLRLSLLLLLDLDCFLPPPFLWGQNGIARLTS